MSVRLRFVRLARARATCVASLPADASRPRVSHLQFGECPRAAGLKQAADLAQYAEHEADSNQRVERGSARVLKPLDRVGRDSRALAKDLPGEALLETDGAEAGSKEQEYASR